jgi:pimeloyl-ACP methyl ester carboxylesterase
VRVDEHTADLDGILTYYRSTDPIGPALVYLHGIPTSSDIWEPMLERTGGVAPDLIGFGRSAKAGHLDYTLTGLAGHAARLLDHLELTNPTLVGHDWGALVALDLARQRPVGRLVLIAPPPLTETRLTRAWRTPLVGELVMGATTRTLLARRLRAGSTDPRAWTRARTDAVWTQFDQGTQRAILRLVRSAGDDVIGSGGPRSSIGSWSFGTDVATVLWGEEDPWYPPTVPDAYAARLPGASVERIAGAGHWPWLDRPEVVDHAASLLEG